MLLLLGDGGRQAGGEGPGRHSNMGNKGVLVVGLTSCLCCGM